MSDQINVNAIANTLQTKVDLPTGFSQSDVDFVIDYQAPTSSNNYTWYRKYKSGWVEQGGWTSSISNQGSVSLAKQMADIGYTITMTPSALKPNGGTEGDSNWVAFAWQSKTTTYFTVSLVDSDGTGAKNNFGFYWRVEGIGA